MIFQSEIEIANSRKHPRRLILEPWGEELEIPAGKMFLCKAYGNNNGDFEIEEELEGVIVYIWSGATVRVFCEEIEIGGNRPIVPDVPEGFDTSTFLGFMFGIKAN